MNNKPTVLVAGNGIFYKTVVKELQKTDIPFKMYVGHPADIRLLLHKYDIILTASFGYIFTEEDLQQRATIVNLHPSDLPNYPGPAPIQQQILDRRPYIKVTLIRTVAAIDAGPQLQQSKEYLINYMPFYVVAKKLAVVGAKLFANWYKQNSTTAYLSTETRKLYEKDRQVIDDQYEKFLCCYELPHKNCGWLITAYKEKIAIAPALCINNQIQIIANGSAKLFGTVFRYDKIWYVQLKTCSVAITEVRREGKNWITPEEYVNGVQNNA